MTASPTRGYYYYLLLFTGGIWSVWRHQFLPHAQYRLTNQNGAGSQTWRGWWAAWTEGTHFTSHVSRVSSLISHLTAHISHLTSRSSHLTSHISHLTSHNATLSSLIFPLTFHVQRLTSHISHLTSLRDSTRIFVYLARKVTWFSLLMKSSAVTTNVSSEVRSKEGILRLAFSW